MGLAARVAFSLDGAYATARARPKNLSIKKSPELLAEIAVRRRTFAFVWVLGMFIIVPLIGVAIFR